jgi:hypothetical protein
MAWGIRILIFIGVLMLLAFMGLWAALCVASDEDDRMEGCVNAARQKDSEPDRDDQTAPGGNETDNVYPEFEERHYYGA